MLRLNDHVRFTDSETAAMLKIGIDLTGVHSQAAINAEFARWANALAQRHPDLLEKIANELARVIRQSEEPEPAYNGEQMEPGLARS
ncbi:MAG: cytochrome P450 [Betaproteobacteria bacterium]|nr:cytochrome P450 [Betaproteobacteria bacterium]